MSDGAEAAAAAPMSGAVARGVSWAAIGKLGSQAIQFGSGLVLARLLTAEDYGILASVYVIFGFAVLFFEMGLGAALVHLRDLTEEDLSTAFWINAIGGVMLAVLLSAAAPFIAGFFSEPALVYIAPVVALSFTLNVGVCHFALLERRLEFRALAVMEIAAAIVGVGVSITLAVTGVGALALAIGPVVQSATLSLLLWVHVPWYPRRFIVRSSVRRLWGFSGGQLGFNVIWYWGRNADNLLIGRFLGAAPLGYYNRAYNLMLLPVQQVSQVLGRVMFPALAAMADDKARVAAGYRRAVRLITLVAAPLLVGMSATAPALVPTLWGPGWGDTVPLMQVLCIAGVPQCIGASVGWIYQSQGRTGTMFKMALWQTPLMVAAMVIGLQWDGVGVAVAVLVCAWALTPITLHVACRIVGLSASRVLLDNAPTLMLCAVLGAVVWLVPTALSADREAVWILGLQVITGVAVYALGARLVQPEVWRELTSLARQRAGRTADATP